METPNPLAPGLLAAHAICLDLQRALPPGTSGRDALGIAAAKIAGRVETVELKEVANGRP